MLLNKDVSNYIKGKIKWNSYSDKHYVQYILELCELGDHIKNWFKWPYFHWFTIDYLIDKYFDDYIELIKEIKWIQESIEIKNNYEYFKTLSSIDETYDCINKGRCKWKGIDFSLSWDLFKWENIWIELEWVK